MTARFRFSLALLLLLFTASPTLAQSRDVNVMAFNIRYAHSEPPNLWLDRRAAVREIIVQSGADIIGTQEGLYHQVADMDHDLPDFDWIGVGREGGSGGEYMAIFYRRDRFQPRQYDHFWLSDTPALIGSRSWGNNLPRMVTWVRFLDRLSEREFYLVDTHFDHQSQPARERSAVLLLKQTADFDPDLPIIVTGDFNAAAPENPVYQTLTAPGAFLDSWTAVHDSEPPMGTSHGFRGLEAAMGRNRIDWVLTRGPVEVVEAAILTDEFNGQYPSDHFPVTARLRFR